MRKTVLITGGSRGIGKATALTFAKAGYNVIINYVSNSTRAQETKKLIESFNVEAWAFKCDVSDVLGVNDMIKESIQTVGKIDVLINNAGIKKDGPIENMEESDWDKVMNINVKGTWAMIKTLLNQNPENHPMRIINISSETGIIGKVNQVNYAASKFAINGLTKSLAKELGPKNITVNAVAPSLTKTDMTDYVNADKRNHLKKTNPLRRLGTPQDIAEACLFLASDQASFINGQILPVNGGVLSL